MPNEKDGIPMEEQAQRLFRVAIKTPEHLKAWLEESGRRWIVIDALDMVDALPFPEGHNAFMEVIACYRDHRMTVPSGRTEPQKDMLGKPVQVEVMKTDVLEPAELDRAIRFLVGQITEQVPDWSLDNPSM